MTTADKVSSSGARAADSEALQTLAAVGVVALAVVHLLIGWLGLQIAWSGGGAQADASGAFATLAAQPIGTVLLWVVTIGLAALVVWQLGEAAFGHHGSESGKRTLERVKSGAKAVAYAVLAVAAARFAIGQGSSSSESQRSLTARLLDAPAGQVLVGAIGIAIVGVGAYLVYKGVKKRFLKELKGEGTGGHVGRAVVRLGQVGYVAKGVAYGLLGVLVVVAAVRHDPEQSGGLDTALQTLRDQPYGQWLLTLVALGFAAYGIYCLAWARALRADAQK